MSLLDRVVKSNAKRRPRKTILYGTRGIGKSTFGAMFPKPIFIPCEDGLQDLAVDTFPLCTSFADVMQNTWELGHEDHPFQTVAIDTMDWAVRLAERQVCDSAGKDAITDFSFGKGYGAVLELISKLLKLLDGCVDRGMEVLILAHAKIERFEDPSHEGYDRYGMKLHKTIDELIAEWADEYLFANHEVIVKKSGEGFNETTKATGSGARFIWTTERPSHKAKNRLFLPEKIPLDAREYLRIREECIARIDAQNSDNF